MNISGPTIYYRATLLGCCLFAHGAFAETAVECAAMIPDSVRLACYDGIYGTPSPQPAIPTIERVGRASPTQRDTETGESEFGLEQLTPRQREVRNRRIEQIESTITAITVLLSSATKSS